MRATAVSLTLSIVLAAAPVLADAESSAAPASARTPSAADAASSQASLDDAVAQMSPRDVTLTYCVLNRIGDLAGVDSGDVHVRVVRGAVTLFGTLDSEQGRTRILLAANGCDGVRVLRDEMSLVPSALARGGGPSDPEIAAAASRFAHERGVVGGPLSFEVHHGVVTIRGEVDRFDDALRVVRKVRAVPGVRAVRSSLDVNQSHVVLVRDYRGDGR